MVLSTLALVGIIQLFLLLAGGIFFLFLHTRFLKKQIRKLRGDSDDTTDTAPPAVAAMTESSEAESDNKPETAADSPLSEASSSDSARDKTASETSKKPHHAASPIEGKGFIPAAKALNEDDAVKVTGEIAELRKMLNEKLLLTANLRKLIEALTDNLDNPDNTAEIASQQTSSLLHLEEYIKLSRKEAAAVEEKITHYREQLAKAKKLLNRYKEQHEHDLKQLEEDNKAHEAAQVPTEQPVTSEESVTDQIKTPTSETPDSPATSTERIETTAADSDKEDNVKPETPKPE